MYRSISHGLAQIVQDGTPDKATKTVKIEVCVKIDPELENEFIDEVNKLLDRFAV